MSQIMLEAPVEVARIGGKVMLELTLGGRTVYLTENTARQIGSALAAFEAGEKRMAEVQP